MVQYIYVPSQYSGGKGASPLASRSRLGRYIAHLKDIETAQDSVGAEIERLQKQAFALENQRNKLLYLIAREQKLLAHREQEQEEQALHRIEVIIARARQRDEQEAAARLQKHLREVRYRQAIQEQMQKQAQAQHNQEAAGSFVSLPFAIRRNRNEEVEDLPAAFQRARRQQLREAQLRDVDEFAAFKSLDQILQNRKRGSRRGPSTDEYEAPQRIPAELEGIPEQIQQQFVIPQETKSEGTTPMQGVEEQEAPQTEAYTRQVESQPTEQQQEEQEAQNELLNAISQARKEQESAQQQQQQQTQGSQEEEQEAQLPQAFLSLLSELASQRLPRSEPTDQEQEQDVSLPEKPTTASPFVETPISEQPSASDIDSEDLDFIPGTFIPRSWLKPSDESESSQEPNFTSAPVQGFETAGASQPKEQVFEETKLPNSFVEDKIKTIKGKVQHQLDLITPTTPKNKLLQIQSELEKLYSSLDAITIDHDDLSTLPIRKLKHEVTTLAVDGAEEVDSLVRPSEDSGSEHEFKPDGANKRPKEESVPSPLQPVSSGHSRKVTLETVDDNDEDKRDLSSDL